MTRDEHRKACIEAMARIIAARDSGDDEPNAWEDEPADYQQYVIETATAAFDSLHGVALVLRGGIFGLVINGALYKGAELRALSAAPHDLTNAPEPKP